MSSTDPPLHAPHGDSELTVPRAPLRSTYQLERIVSHSPGSIVYAAKHLRLNRPVAVKCLTAEFASDEHARARFEREAEIVSTLRHPHLVDFLDFDETEDGRLFIVLEYLKGESLAHRMSKGAPLSATDSVDLACQMGSALHAAHLAGVVHRDVKPANIFLVSLPGKLFTKLLDFGVSKQRGENGVMRSPAVTAEFELLGTPRYMPPEQCSGASATVDARGDQYSLATILYELLTGAHPSGEATGPALFRSILVDPVRAPSERNPALPAELDAVLLRALEKTPAERFPTTVAFSAALRSAMGLISVSSTPLPSRIRTASAPQRPDVVLGQSPTLPWAAAAAVAKAPAPQATTPSQESHPQPSKPPEYRVQGGYSMRKSQRSHTPQPAGTTQSEGRHPSPVGTSPLPGTGYSLGRKRRSSTSPSRDTVASRPPIDPAKTPPVGLPTTPSPAGTPWDDEALERSLQQARSELLLGNEALALVHLKSVIETAAHATAVDADRAQAEAMRIVRSLVRARYAGPGAQIEQVRTVHDVSFDISPHDAFILSLAEIGLRLVDVADSSPMGQTETWYRISLLLSRGLIIVRR